MIATDFPVLKSIRIHRYIFMKIITISLTKQSHVKKIFEIIIELKNR